MYKINTPRQVIVNITFIYIYIVNAECPGNDFSKKKSILHYALLLMMIITVGASGAAI